jgi:hypothetical protein
MTIAQMQMHATTFMKDTKVCGSISRIGSP